MVRIVVGQHEQHSSGFDLVSLICISFNMPFFCSKMSVLINSSWNRPVCITPVQQNSLRRFFPGGKNEGILVWGVSRAVTRDIMQIPYSVMFLCVNPLELRMHHSRRLDSQLFPQETSQISRTHRHTETLMTPKKVLTLWNSEINLRFIFFLENPQGTATSPQGSTDLTLRTTILDLVNRNIPKLWSFK